MLPDLTVILSFCADFDVNIQLPPKGSDKEEIITITGLEADALAAKDAILKERVGGIHCSLESHN